MLYRQKGKEITQLGESDPRTMRLEEVGQNEYIEVHSTKPICLQIPLPCLLEREQHLELRLAGSEQDTLDIFLNTAS